MTYDSYAIVTNNKRESDRIIVQRKFENEFTKLELDVFWIKIKN